MVLDGEVEIVREGDDEVVIAADGPGGFVGELNLLTGQRPYLSARVSRAGRVLSVPPEQFRQLLDTKPDLSDTIFQAFVARREILRSEARKGAIRLIGSQFSPEALALRAFANRAHLPHTWIDIEDLDDVRAYLAGLDAGPDDVPVAVMGDVVLRRTTPGEFAAMLGLTYRSVPGSVTDLVVVGTGPAGVWPPRYTEPQRASAPFPSTQSHLADRPEPARAIENYVGFPNGISGGDLTARAAIQAQRLGAHLNAPCEAVGLTTEEAFHIVALADGSEIATRAVIIASGAQYRRLAVSELERFEGAGVYYVATELEARLCRNSTVGVVGGGNSAGQAAIYLSQQGSRVILIVRRRELVETMSQYLIARINADPHIEVMTHTEVRGLGVIRTSRRSRSSTPPADPVGPSNAEVCSVSSGPSRRPPGWATASLDRNGFVLTDRSLSDNDINREPPSPTGIHSPSRRPFQACSPSATYDWAQ